MNTEFAHRIRSEGYSKQADFGVALGGVLNIALDPLFIFVFRLNIAGAAIATMLSNLIAMPYFFAAPISGIAWATPFADRIAFGISVVLMIPCLLKLKKKAEKAVSEK